MKKITVISGIIFILLVIYQFVFNYYLMTSDYNSNRFLNDLFSGVQIFIFWLLTPISAGTYLVSLKNTKSTELPIESHSLIKRIISSQVLPVVMILLIYFYSVMYSLSEIFEGFGKAFN